MIYRMTRLILLCLFVVLLAMSASAAEDGAQNGRPHSTSCENLSSLKLPDTTITAAELVSPPAKFGADAVGPQAVKVTVAFCRVAAMLKPSPDSNIGVEVWLPPTKAWNGKFLGTGNGGAGGSIYYSALAAGVQLGFATANTDAGTSGTKGTGFAFGLGHPEKQIDYAYRAIHLMTVISKRIMEAFYGGGPKNSYFTGCSAGGFEAMAEADRFPNDYDGIVAGDPAYDQPGMGILSGWSYAVNHRDAGSAIPPEKLPMINRAVLAECDGLDGLVDGIIDDPRRCGFDPSVILCSGADSSACLTAPQVETLRKIYDGARNPRTHELIFPGPTPGSELNPGSMSRFTGGPTGSMVTPSTPGVLAWVLGPDWKQERWLSFDFDQDVARIEAQLVSTVDNSNPDLSAFKKHGGKIILYTGWADSNVPALDLVNLYERIEGKMGGAGKTVEFARLFMVPGMFHCFGGPGPSSFGQSLAAQTKSDGEHNVLVALDRWVTRGVPPQRIVATKYVNDDPKQGIARTRPLCVYPQVARWEGVGSIDDASDFACVAPPGQSQALLEQSRSTRQSP
jgi:feruloyl esterase